MSRSFEDRVFGGVCGGVSAQFRVSSWALRALVVILTVISGGAVAALYVMLWWSLPQNSPMNIRRSSRGSLIFLLFSLATLAGTVGRAAGLTISSSGTDLFWPVVLVVLAGIFFLRQVRN